MYLCLPCLFPKILRCICCSVTFIFDIFLTKTQSYDCEVSVSYFTKYTLVRRHHTRLGLTERVWIELAWLDEKKPTVSCLTLNLSCTFVFHIPKNQIKILNFLSCYHVDIKLSALVRCIHEKLVMRI